MLQNFLKIKNRTLFWNTIEKILISKNQNNFTKITISTTDGNIMTYQDKGQSTDIADYVITLISDNFDTDNNRISQNGKFLKIKNEIWNLEFLKEARQRVKRGGNKEIYLHFKNSTRIIRGNDEVEDILDLLPQLQSLTTVENIINSENGSTPTLQQVTEQGNNIDRGINIQHNKLIVYEDDIQGYRTEIAKDSINFVANNGKKTILALENLEVLNGTVLLYLPDKDGTLAITDDIAQNIDEFNNPVLMNYKYNGEDVYRIAYNIDIASDKISHSIEIPSGTLFINFIKIELFNRNQFGDTVNLKTVGSFSSIIEFAGNDDDGSGESPNTIKAGKIYGIVEYSLEQP